MNAIIISNWILTALLFLLVLRQYKPKKKATRESFEAAVEVASASLEEAQEWLEVERLARASRPIHHPKAQGPTTATLTRGHGYWRPKDDLKAEPFLAAWYEKDTTFDAGPLASDDIIPADTYVDLTGRKIPGPKFRGYYEPAEEVMVVSKVKPKARRHNTNLVTEGATALAPKLSPEEEEKLAEEYELGAQVTDRSV